ncbi:MAG: arginine--tRNA ligase [bacterium]|nr:arginine--tRNA ligase [bacterium]
MTSFLNIKEETRKAIATALRDAFGVDETPPIIMMVPPRLEFGDLSVQCAPFAKVVRENPAKIAATLAEKLRDEPMYAWVGEVGAYLNFKIKPEVFFGGTIQAVAGQKSDFGKSPAKTGRKTMVEWISPNTNKPLHVGHLRNGALGDALIRILRGRGEEVVSAMLINDRGIHICKSMWAYQKFGNGETPESAGMKGDHFVGRWYVRFAEELKKVWEKHLENHSELKDLAEEDLAKAKKTFERNEATPSRETREMLRAWEAGDTGLRALWKKMNQWVYDGYEETFRRLGWQFDIRQYESETYLYGKEIVREGLERGVFQRKPDGAVVVEFPKEDFGEDEKGNPRIWAMLRPDGTTLYPTQDLEATRRKFEDYNLNACIFVVGSEQDDHFRHLFKTLEMLGYSWAKNCFHLSHGMVSLPEGKMKSREGTVVDADDLVEEVTENAREQIRAVAEEKLAEEEVNRRANVIALAAIKFFLLRQNPKINILFDPKKTLDFQGATGPYCQYAYARCKSILRKAEGWERESAAYDLLGAEEELALLHELVKLPETVKSAAEKYDPSVLAQYVFETAQAFNQFYHACPVLSEKQGLRQARLALVRTTATVIQNGLRLLGIETLEVM